MSLNFKRSVESGEGPRHNFNAKEAAQQENKQPNKGDRIGRREEKQTVGTMLKAFISSRSNSASKRTGQQDKNVPVDANVLTKYLEERQTSVSPESPRGKQEEGYSNPIRPRQVSGKATRKPPKTGPVKVRDHASRSHSDAQNQRKTSIKECLKDMIRTSGFELSNSRERKQHIQEEENAPEPRKLRQSMNDSIKNETLGGESITLLQQNKQAQSLRMALMYKKEAIENRKRRGIQTDISLKDFNEPQKASFDLESDEQFFPDEDNHSMHEQQFQCMTPDLAYEHHEHSKSGHSSRNSKILLVAKPGSIHRQHSESPHSKTTEESVQNTRRTVGDRVSYARTSEYLMRAEGESQDLNKTTESRRNAAAGQIVRKKPAENSSNYVMTTEHSNTARISVASKQFSKVLADCEVQSYDGATIQKSPDFARLQAPFSAVVQSRDILNRAQNSSQKQSDSTNIEEEDLSESEPSIETPPYELFYFPPMSPWDFLLESETEFHQKVESSIAHIYASKGQLQQPLGLELRVPGDEDPALKLETITTLSFERLRLIRTNLKQTLIESFFPHMLEIIQLKDRYRLRKQTYKHSLLPNNYDPVKSNILKDICSRLSQKLFIKTLFLSKQFKKDLSQLFEAYFDLLVRKPQWILAFYALKKNVQVSRQKKQYTHFAASQIAELKKTQVFDCWKRLKTYNDFEEHRGRQAQKILQEKKRARVVASWRATLLTKRASQIGIEIARRFRVMRLRHWLFCVWSDWLQQNRATKKKALQMLQKQETLHLPYDLLDDSDSVSSLSVATGIHQASRQILVAQKSLLAKKERAGALFFAAIQTLVLEKEHYLTQAQTLFTAVTVDALNSKFHHLLVEYFDQNKRFSLFKRQSQAFLSNKEQLYLTYPDLAPQKLVARRIQANTEVKVQNVEVSVLSEALKPQFIQKIERAHQMVSSSPQDTVLSTKFSIHAALVHQQNTFGIERLGKTQNESSVNQTYRELRDQTREQCSILSNLKPIVAFETRRNKTQPRTSRHTRNLSMKERGKSPNQLYQRIVDKNQSQEKSFTRTQMVPKAEKEVCKVPLKVQLQEHIRSLVENKNEIQARKTLGSNYHLSQALQSVVKTQAFDHHIKLTDFIQVASQTGVPFKDLNAARLMSQKLQQWREALLSRLLKTDLEHFNSLHAGKRAVRAWFNFLKEREHRAINQYKAKQMQNFYVLFKQWTVKNRQLLYSENKQVRLFRLKRLMTRWRFGFLPAQGFIARKFRQAEIYHNNSLKTKSLLGLYHFFLKRNRVTKFKRRWAYLKFFKRRWQSTFEKNQILRNVLLKYEQRENQHTRGRLERMQDKVRTCLGRWKQRVEEKKMLYKTYVALTHYKYRLLSKHMRYLRRGPLFSKAAQLISSVVAIRTFQPTFSRIRAFVTDQKVNLRNFMLIKKRKQMRRLVNGWHAVSVKQKIAKLYVQRRYLRALQDFIYRQNYQRPFQHFEKQLLIKVFYQLKGQRKERKVSYKSGGIEEIVYKRQMKKMMQGFRAIFQNVLSEKRKRMIYCTVLDFRRHALIEKAFKRFKLLQMQEKRQRLLLQVAHEFREERIRLQLEIGQQTYKLDQSSGSLINSNQDLQKRVIQTWRESSSKKSSKTGRSSKQSKLRMENSVENFIQEQTHMLKVRCFLSWRSIARFKNESCTSQSDFLKRSVRSERSQNQEVANVMERLQKEYAKIDSSLQSVSQKSAPKQTAATPPLPRFINQCSSTQFGEVGLGILASKTRHYQDSSTAFQKVPKNININSSVEDYFAAEFQDDQNRDIHNDLSSASRDFSQRNTRSQNFSQPFLNTNGSQDPCEFTQAHDQTHWQKSAITQEDIGTTRSRGGGDSQLHKLLQEASDFCARGKGRPVQKSDSETSSCVLDAMSNMTPGYVETSQDGMSSRECRSQTKLMKIQSQHINAQMSQQHGSLRHQHTFADNFTLTTGEPPQITTLSQVMAPTIQEKTGTATMLNRNTFLNSTDSIANPNLDTYLQRVLGNSQVTDNFISTSQELDDNASSRLLRRRSRDSNNHQFSAEFGVLNTVTDRGLFTELEHIFMRNQKDWQEEQTERQRILNELQNQYRTSLAISSDMNSLSVDEYHSGHNPGRSFVQADADRSFLNRRSSEFK